MKLVYLTAKRYPPTTADHIYIRALALAFARILGAAFTLILAGKSSEELVDIQVHVTHSPRRFRTLFYSLWLPLFVRARRDKDLVFFCNDLNLLSLLVFWRGFSRNAYRICSDWHLMTETWRDRYVARGSDLLITTSWRLKERLIEGTGIEERKVQVVYGGVDMGSYTGPLPSRAEIGLPHDPFLIGYVGLFTTLGHDKGLRTMVDALNFLPEDIHVAFVGGSDEEIRLYREYAETRGVANRCVWIRRQEPGRVPIYERSMDGLVIPYPDKKHFRDYGFPMKVYEYLAAGRPIIYSDLDILKEVLSGKGIPFIPDDPRSLARAVELLRSGAANDLSQKAQINVSAYSWDEKARSILDALKVVHRSS